jgi:hypothetical protein
MGESKIREHLEEANQHVKKGDDLIEQQEKRVQEMARDGHQTQIHKQYLETLREVKETFERNRDSIRDEVEGSGKE